MKELLLQKSEPRTSMWGMTYTGCLDQFFTTVQIEKPALIAETFDPLFMHVYASFFILELGIKL